MNTEMAFTQSPNKSSGSTGISTNQPGFPESRPAYPYRPWPLPRPADISYPATVPILPPATYWRCRSIARPELENITYQRVMSFPVLYATALLFVGRSRWRKNTVL
jgi:hypothetical protein